MKKIFTNIIILILFIGIFIPSSNANAQSPANPGPGDIGTCTYTGPGLPPTPNIPYKLCIDGGGTWTANPPSSQTTPTPEQKADDGSWWSNAFFGGINSFVNGVFYGILWLMSWIVWFAGTLLNYVLDFTIVNMQKNISGLTGINIAWKIIRDLMNIAFIFLLVYEGIKLIIDQGDLKSLKNFIFGVVLASLLINFSLFFTKVLIDASNVVTLGIYTSITGPTNSSINSGLSDPITKALGISSVYGDKAQPDIFGGKTIGPKLVMLFGSGIVILVTAFAFFAIAIMFIIRFVALILLMMTSPIAYMGMAIPAMKSYSNEWWESLKGQLLFAPIFMVMMLISITLMSSDGFIVQKDFAALLTTAEKPDFSTMGLMLNFTIIIGLIFGSIIVSKKTSASGSKYIGNATKNLTSFAGSAIIGGAASGMRKSFGYIGNKTANDDDRKERMALLNTKSADGTITWRERGELARHTATMAVARKAADSSFDLRSTKLNSMISKGADVNLGSGTVFNEKAGKGGYKKEEEERIKKETKYAESLKPSDRYIEEKKEEAKKEAQIIENQHNEALRKTEELNKAKKEAEKEMSDTIENDLSIKNDENSRKEANAEIDRLNKEKEEKIRRMSSPIADESIKNSLQSDIREIDKQIEKQKELEKNLGENIDRAKESIKNGFKIRLDDLDNQIKIQTEQEKKIAKDLEEAEKTKKEKIESIDKTYERRVEAYAKKVENGGVISRYGSTIARIGLGSAIGGAIAGPAGAVAAGLHQALTAPNLPSVDRREIASKIRAVKKKKQEKELSADEKKKQREIISNPDSTEDEKTEAWEKLGAKAD